MAPLREWLRRHRGQNQTYFIIEFEGRPIGTVGFTPRKVTGFGWSLLVLQGSRPHHAAMESSLMLFAYALDLLGFSETHLDILKGNKRVLQFHDLLRAQSVGETELNLLYRFDATAISDYRQRYSHYISDLVEVRYL